MANDTTDSSGRLFLEESDFTPLHDEAGNEIGSVPKHWGADLLPAGASLPAVEEQARADADAAELAAKEEADRADAEAKEKADAEAKEKAKAAAPKPAAKPATTQQA